jgi:hypothetical protein
VPLLFRGTIRPCGLFTRRPHYSYFAVRCHYEAPGPAADFLVLENFLCAAAEALAVRGTEANEQDAVMRPWSKSPNVGEIQVLRDQESLVPLSRFPDVAVAPAAEIFLRNRVNIVVETR